jgi:hypothetical protein
MSAKKNEGQVVIPAPNFKKVSVEIKGISPLIYHRFSEKARKQIEGKQGKKAAGPKKARDPEAEYQESYYRDSKGNIVMPPKWIKTAMVGACRFSDNLPMTIARGAFFVWGNKEGWIPVEYEKEEMDEDWVRISRKTTTLRYRGKLINWGAMIDIDYDADLLSPEQVLNLLARAGLQQGIGEKRPQQTSGDIFGRFEIVGGKNV